ncbi:MAG TPA: hypothetical protein VK929_09895 [Longimicrobiales bacterium]|nr:hypothetical protein [Longimicrobiales bacterium]
MTSSAGTVIRPEPPQLRDERVHSIPHVAAFTLLWAILQAGFALGSPEVLQGDQIDTDGYMRLVRLGVLLDGGGWFDGTIPRSNWPFGEVHHWTRPLDALLVAVMLPFAAFMDTAAAAAVAGAIISPLCHLALCIAAVWIVQPLVPGPERFFAMPAMLAQPGLIGYGTVGRADHHMLIFLLAALALGAWIRALLEPGRRRWGVAAGALSAVGVWVSPESLLPLLLLFASGGLAWVLRGSRMVEQNVALCGGLVMGLAVALVLERPPSEWLWQEFDRISIAHLTMGLLAITFWWTFGRLRGASGDEPAPRLTAADGGEQRAASAASSVAAPGWRDRLLRGGVGAVLAVALLAAVHPRFFHGPWEGVDPGIIDIWLSGVQELQPLVSSEASGLGRSVVFFGPVLFLLPLAISALAQDRHTPRAPVRAFLLLSLLVYVPMAAYQARFAGYMGLVMAVLMMVLISRLLTRADAIVSVVGRGVLRIAFILGVLMSPLLMGEVTGALVSAAGVATSGVDDDDEVAGLCRLDGVARVLSEPESLGSQPRTIAAFIDFGPELLYRTPHRILAGPYHRNADGIVAAYALLTAADPITRDSIAAARQVDLILICPPRDSVYFGRYVEVSLYTELRRGMLPGSYREVELPDDVPAGFRLFEVDRRRPGGSD